MWNGSLIALTLLGSASIACAQEEKERESPWLLAPVISVSPKLGTSFGALAGYLHYFDDKSQVSTFGVTGQYTTTGSLVAGVFGKGSFDEDHQRFVAGIVHGRIRNDYDDFLGTGVPLKSTDDLSAGLARYLIRVKDSWFVGPQGIYTNYTILGDSIEEDRVLNVLGLTGFRSGGIGASIYHDSRDQENMPSSGWLLNLNNIAYRDWLAGDENFDRIILDFRGFWPTGDGHILGVRFNNHWTIDAPPSANATLMLRGYKQGQYLGENMSSIEAEERFRLGERWTATVFLGVAALYGEGRDFGEAESMFPNVGAGLQYLLKPEAGIVANLEYAKGEGDNYGIYVKVGYSW